MIPTISSETAQTASTGRRAPPQPACGVSLTACKACGKCSLSALLDAITPGGDNRPREPN